MTRNELFEEIATKIYDEGFLCEDNYPKDEHDALIHDVASCIEKALDSYSIIEGPCDVLRTEREKEIRG